MSITTDLEKKIADAFVIFDHQGNKTVDVREIGTILRYLGCVPSENEINEIISATEFEDSNGTIHLSRFLPHVTQLLAEHKWVRFYHFVMSAISHSGRLSFVEIGWRLPPLKNCWKHFVFLMSRAMESFRNITLPSWWWKRVNHSHRWNPSSIQFEEIKIQFSPFSGGIGWNDGHRSWHTNRRHSVRVLHQLADGEFRIECTFPESQINISFISCRWTFEQWLRRDI